MTKPLPFYIKPMLVRQVLTRHRDRISASKHPLSPLHCYPRNFKIGLEKLYIDCPGNWTTPWKMLKVKGRLVNAKRISVKPTKLAQHWSARKVNLLLKGNEEPLTLVQMLWESLLLVSVISSANQLSTHSPLSGLNCRHFRGHARSRIRLVDFQKPYK